LHLRSIRNHHSRRFDYWGRIGTLTAISKQKKTGTKPVFFVLVD